MRRLNFGAVDFFLASPPFSYAKGLHFLLCRVRRGSLLSILHIIFQHCALEYLFVVGCGAFRSQAGDLHVMRCVLLVVENVFLDID
jgi:hypothetical protein